jgi:hypothetical protein
MLTVGRAPSGLWEDPGAAHRSEFRIGGVSVRVVGSRPDDVTLLPSLSPFRAEGHACDITIQVEWAEGLGPPAGRPLFDSGSVWRLYADGCGFQFDFSAPTLGTQLYKRLFVDDQFRRARLQMNARSFAGTECAAVPLEYPLDELLIMHRLTQEKGIELHSCGIVRSDGTGNLFVGHSGAGKSTTTRLWTEREDVEILSDDRIIVRRDEGGSEAGTPRRDASSAEGKGILRLCDRSASPISHFAQDDRLKANHFGQDVKPKKTSGMRMYGTPWHGEAMYASPNSTPLSRIFILEHGRGNAITLLSPSQAVAELFARSFVPFHRHEYVESALEFLQEVVDSVPVYRYEFEPDRRAVETIINFHD